MSDKEQSLQKAELKAEFNFDNPDAVGVRVNAVVEVAKIDHERELVSFNKDFGIVPISVLRQIVANWDLNKKTADEVRKQKSKTNK